LQPVITFFSEEFSFTQKKSSFVVIILILILSQFVIFFPGFLDEFDFWAGTILLIILAIIEIIIFVFYIAPDDPVASINHGSLIKVPKFFNKIFKFWLPMLLITLFLSWVFQDINSEASIILRKSLSTYLSRLILISLFLAFLGLVYKKVFK